MMRREQSLEIDITRTFASRSLPSGRERHEPARALPARRPRAGRGGFSMLELQVALVVFGIALTGLGPLVVMHSRQLKKLEGRFSPGTTYYLIPASDLWARKLGASASLATSSSTTTPSSGPPAVNDVQIQSLEKTLESQTVTAFVTVQTIH
jgi:prepilin-type N-terminal cleavage/methylation domain-containing protein